MSFVTEGARVQSQMTLCEIRGTGRGLSLRVSPANDASTIAPYSARDVAEQAARYHISLPALYCLPLGVKR
jgi:hypothetical protein